MITDRFNSDYSTRRVVLQVIFSLAIGIFLFLTLILMIVLIYMGQFEDRILPGVSVASIDLSGLTIEEASIKLGKELDFPVSGRITLRDGERSWILSPIELGLLNNSPESIYYAYQVGRSGGLISRIESLMNSYLEGLDLPAIVMYDERVSTGYLQKLINEIEEPVIEAELYLDGSSVVSKNGRTGRVINLTLSLKNISEQLQTYSNGEVEIVVEEIAPSILDVEQEAEILRNLMNSPLELVLPEHSEFDPGPWVVNSTDVAGMIKIEKIYKDGSAEFNLGLYDSSLYILLNEIEGDVERFPQNTKFIFNDDTRQLDILENAIIGRRLNVDESMRKIRDEIFNGSNVISLVTDIDPPMTGNNVTAQDLGITELVSTGITYFWGSSAERIQNIKTASERFHGLLVAPGETFSMGDALGDVSLENGYAEALIIYGNRTITGVGGGVCQVSTTLFRTVFFSGYPVVERHPHAYRVGYYEQTYSGAKDSSLAGLDATVYVPLVDFKFKNDSQFWLLMETYVNTYDHRLTWKFYSTNDGRSVQWNTTGPQNIDPAPDPLFLENPDLDELEMKQVDWSADGADVIVTRIVYKNSAVYLSDEFRTSYKPWQAICQYGVDVSDPEAKAADLGICQ